MGAHTNSVHQAEPEKLQLYVITPPDFEEVARYVLRMSGSNTPLPQAVERLSWILLENPSHDPADPLGWVLRAPSGEVVGCMCCAPQKFSVGTTTCTLMMANSFYVDDRYRGGGTSIFLKYLQLGRRYPLFVSSANPTVANMWRRLGGYPLGDSEHEVFTVLHWPPILAESAYRKTHSDFLSSCAHVLASPWPRAREEFGADAEGHLRPLETPQGAVALCS